MSKNAHLQRWARSLSALAPRAGEGRLMGGPDLEVHSEGVQSYTTVGFSDQQDQQVFAEVVAALHGSDRELIASVGLKVVEEAVASVVFRAGEGAVDVGVEDLKAALHDLRARPMIAWEVFRALVGAFLLGEEPLHLGPFTVYTQAMYRARVREVHAACSERLIDLPVQQLSAEALVIGVSINTRDPECLYEKARYWFGLFDDAARFCIGRRGLLFDAAVVDPVQFSWARSLAVHKDDAWGLTSFSGTIPFDISSLTSTEDVRGRVWARLADQREVHGKARSDLVHRIVTAVAWIGKAIRDPQPASAVTQCMFALEALFTSDSKEERIAQRLADFCAFLSGRDLDERKQVAKRVKRLYGLRSGVAHGGNIQITEADVRCAIQLCRDAVSVLLMDEALRHLTTFQQLEEWLADRRYAGSPSPVPVLSEIVRQQ